MTEKHSELQLSPSHALKSEFDTKILEACPFVLESGWNYQQCTALHIYDRVERKKKEREKAVAPCPECKLKVICKCRGQMYRSND